tara:strand:+ start:3002 stop:3154 length:153 start_codon:yes stop_codon:yes gene_type:complete
LNNSTFFLHHLRYEVEILPEILLLLLDEPLPEPLDELLLFEELELLLDAE